MKKWQMTLKTICEALDQQPITWIVVGSVASAIRGCAFEPRDLDLLAPDYASLEQLASLVTAQLGETENEPILTQEFPGGFKWHKRFWHADGFEIDASFIESGGGIPDSEDGSGVWEGGKLIWKYVEGANFEGFRVPVPPLCVQLESQLRRGQAEKAQEVRRVLLAQGYDRDLARRCLSPEGFAYLTASLTG
jgi:hypothetical protein